MNGTVKRARAMRKAMTPLEARLWVGLKQLRNEGYQFRRQAPFRGYFLDFVCNSRRLVVEVDGESHHQYRADHDGTRDAVLAREGFTTLRFTNEDVRDRLDSVMDRVRAGLEGTLPHPGASRRPSP